VHLYGAKDNAIYCEEMYALIFTYNIYISIVIKSKKNIRNYKGEKKMYNTYNFYCIKDIYLNLDTFE